MKSYRLSSTPERVAGLSIFAVLLVCIGFLTYALHKDTLSFIICLVTGLLVGAGLGFYVVNLFLAVCIPHAQSRRQSGGGNIGTAGIGNAFQVSKVAGQTF